MVRLTHRPAALLSALLAAGLVAMLTTAGPAAASATSSPAALAAALQARVAALQVAAEVATEHFDAVESSFGAAVTKHLLAEGQLTRAESLATAQRSAYAARARALYESGGNLGMLASVFDAGSLSDVASTYQDFLSILGAAQTQSRSTGAALAAAGRLARRASALAARQTVLQVAAARSAAAVEADLAAEQQLLAAATAQVRLLAAEQAALAAATQSSYAAGILRSLLGASFAQTAAPNAIAAEAVAAARSRLGDPYVWGGSGPNVFDCSGLTQWSYAQAGVLLPRVAAEQYNAGQHVSLAALQPGDLLFWATNVNDPTTIHHVAMYLGGGMIIEAPHTGANVRIIPVYLDGYIGAIDPTAGLSG